MINELVGSPTRSENLYFANNEQASIDDRKHLLLLHLHAEHHLIKLKLYTVTVNSVLCEIQRNQSNLLTFKSYQINQC